VRTKRRFAAMELLVWVATLLFAGGWMMASAFAEDGLTELTFFRAATPAATAPPTDQVVPTLQFFQCNATACRQVEIEVYTSSHVMQCVPCAALVDAISSGQMTEFRFVIGSPTDEQRRAWDKAGKGYPILVWEDSSGVRRKQHGFYSADHFRGVYLATERAVASRK
jgi:hypothetical protein